MCPADQARTARPIMATPPPMRSVRQLDRANQIKSAPQINPSGTRQRCIHVPPLRNRLAPLSPPGARPPQPLARKLQNLPDRDVHANPVRAGAAVTVRAAA